MIPLLIIATVLDTFSIPRELFFLRIELAHFAVSCTVNLGEQELGQRWILAAREHAVRSEEEL